VKHNQSWISLVGFCLILVLGSALAFAVVVAGASVALGDRLAAASDDAQDAGALASNSKFTGVVTDSRCGARHMRNSQLNAADCARLCVREGASYVLVDGNHQYRLSGDEKALDKLAGQRVTIVGNQQQGVIDVESVAPLSLPGA